MPFDMDLVVVARLLAALGAGAVIGLERTLHGRAAGFRTHILVCTSAALLMLLTVYQTSLVTSVPIEAVRTDPTRMAQGIMTGIGFLGAGVIMREGLTILGLTTAASIWMTAAIGILSGVGFYFAAGLATLLTVGALGFFRWIERIIPAHRYARVEVRFERESAPTEDHFRRLIHEQGLAITDINYRQEGERACFVYEVTVRSRKAQSFGKLAAHLSQWSDVRAFHVRVAGG